MSHTSTFDLYSIVLHSLDQQKCSAYLQLKTILCRFTVSELTLFVCLNFLNNFSYLLIKLVTLMDAVTVLMGSFSSD